jgi:hypothetical protein
MLFVKFLKTLTIRPYLMRESEILAINDFIVQNSSDLFNQHIRVFKSLLLKIFVHPLIHNFIYIYLGQREGTQLPWVLSQEKSALKELNSSKIPK